MAAFYPAYCWHTNNGNCILGAAEILMEVTLPLPRGIVAMAFVVFVKQ